jgi:phosphinothricin acetyltransferase
MSIRIEPMSESDWPSVRRIYAEGIATGNATFETECPDERAWDSSHLPSPRLVAREGDSVVGWAALSAVSRRPVYRGVAEVSVYVGAGAGGRGVGTALLRSLIAEAEAAGIWTLQAGIFPENGASIRLHQACGFRVVGTRERIALHHGRWRDVVLMERRSSAVR